MSGGGGRGGYDEGEEEQPHAPSIDSASMADDRDRSLERDDLDPDPVRQLRRWLEEARAARIELAEAAALATASAGGAPSVRMVLVKDVGDDGLTFFTGYESRKGRDLAENPRAGLLLYWHDLGRQARVEGGVERLPPEESDAYFRSRPLGSRLSAAVSAQSEVVESREELEQAASELGRTVGEALPRPERWGGYRLRPGLWEFWQHRVDRLHDRFRYRPGDTGWIVERLAP
jgi:pyridoxamine 5'-phosphate oxidase